MKLHVWKDADKEKISLLMLNSDKNCVDLVERMDVELVFLEVLKDAQNLKMTKANGRTRLHWTMKEQERVSLMQEVE